MRAATQKTIAFKLVWGWNLPPLLYGDEPQWGNQLRFNWQYNFPKLKRFT